MTVIAERCRLDRRRRAIVESARELFIEQGFERTTLGDIVDRAGGSLATVYKLFGNKDGLLEAVVFEKAASGEAIIGEAGRSGLTPAQALHEIATRLDEHFLDPEVVALVRIVVARSLSDREFARRFFDRTAMRTKQALENLFAEWAAAGFHMKGTPELLADMFLALFGSDLHNEAISHDAGLARSPDRLRARIEFFLAGAQIA